MHHLDAHVIGVAVYFQTAVLRPQGQFVQPDPRQIVWQARITKSHLPRLSVNPDVK